MPAKTYCGVWVFCEHEGGRLLPCSEELLCEGARLAAELGTELAAVALGENVDPLADQAELWGADVFFAVRHEHLKDYTVEAYAKVLCELAGQYHPEIFLFSATYVGRELAPRCAARLKTGLCADCTRLDLDNAGYLSYLKKIDAVPDPKMFREEQFEKDFGGVLKMTMPAFGGNLMATIVCKDTRPVMATVRPGTVRAVRCAQPKNIRVERPAVCLGSEDVPTRVLRSLDIPSPASGLAEAEVVIGVGRGIEKDCARGMAMAGELAELLDGAVGGTRAAVEAGWISEQAQIGQTGVIVRPKLYIALGVSGAMQHMAGVKDAGCIVAINTNPGAPIFDMADHGITGDIFRTVPALIEEIRRIRQI